MKKIILALGVLLVVGCQNKESDYKIYTVFQKEEMIHKAIDKNNIAIDKEIKTEIEKLKKAVKKNDKNAKKELEEWEAFFILRDIKL